MYDIERMNKKPFWVEARKHFSRDKTDGDVARGDERPALLMPELQNGCGYWFVSHHGWVSNNSNSGVSSSVFERNSVIVHTNHVVFFRKFPPDHIEVGFEGRKKLSVEHFRSK